MTYFEPYSFTFDISNHEALERLNIVTKRHYFDRFKFYLFKGSISANSFKLRSAEYPETITLIGEMKSVESNRINLFISGRIIWPYLILNALLFLISSFTLFYLSFLLLNESVVLGISGLLLSGLLSLFLYTQLIGPIKKNYLKAVKAIEDLFNRQLL